jgi:hypothetical protein
MIGARPGGRMTAMSLVALFPPEPVLSATRQPFGTPARNRLSPVLLASNDCLHCEAIYTRCLIARRSELLPDPSHSPAAEAERLTPARKSVHSVN